jgi:hypothetical protein
MSHKTVTTSHQTLKQGHWAVALALSAAIEDLHLGAAMYKHTAQLTVRLGYNRDF